jgi:hypothetical protein
LEEKGEERIKSINKHRYREGELLMKDGERKQEREREVIRESKKEREREREVIGESKKEREK